MSNVSGAITFNHSTEYRCIVINLICLLSEFMYVSKKFVHVLFKQKICHVLSYFIFNLQIEAAIVRRKKMELLRQYASTSLIDEEESVKKVLGV